ncbi:MAG: ABC transporter permease [Acidimicrobiales bacterium]
MAGARKSVAPILLASLRDLQWRSRRFALAALAAGLVFGVALMMSGVANSFSVEITNTVNILGASSWLVRAGSPGPFTDPAPFPATAVAAIRHAPGVQAADPIFVGRALTSGAVKSDPGTSTSPGDESDVNVLGVVPGGVGAPPVVAGQPLAGRHSVVLDESLGVGVGENIALNGTVFTVVGLVDGVTYFAGQPTAFVTLASADELDAGGLPLATAVLIRGAPSQPIPGFTTLTDAQVRTDLGRPTAEADKTIQLIEVLLWFVAAGIIGAIVYLSALERRNDFAVLKAVGTPSMYLFTGLVIQSIAMALGAAAIGILVEIPMAGGSQMAVRLSTSDYLAVPVVAVIVGVVASVFPARRAASIDPAVAFGGGK